jgi:hypothetical protein
MKSNSLKKIGILTCVFVILILAGYFSVKYLLAINNPWLQTDWSGGVSSNIATSSVNTFLNSTDLVTSNPGYLTIPQVQNWDNNMANWTERVKITFDNTQSTLGTAPERLTDFPLFVKLQNGKNIDYTKTQILRLRL